MSRLARIQSDSLSVGSPSPATTMPRERRTKARVACTFCRLKKIKCGGGRPCSNCLDHNSECIYPALQYQKKRAPDQEMSSLQDRLARVEALLSASNIVLTETQRSVAPETSRSAQLMPPPPPLPEIDDGDFAGTMALEGLQALPGTPVSSRLPLPPSPSASSRTTIPTYSLEAPTHLGISEDDDGSSVAPPEEELTYEYHGPGSFLSICSKSGIEWVQGKTGDRSFARLARSLTHNISQRLKLVNAVPLEREPEPNPETSWQYVKAYFDEALESTLGIICRNSFESRLHAHYQQSSHIQPSDCDPAWYALRNTVLAIGCRVSLAKDSSTSFRAAHEQSWKYFQNALSMYAELHFSRTGLMAVQALTIMSLYAEGIEAPALDYMLVSSALKLAEAKGLHRQPAAAWKLSDKAVQIRSSIWWFLYTFDRLIAFRSGRPLSVDDDNINCQLPKFGSNGESCHEIFISMITHAQISSQIATAIARMRSSNPNIDEVIRIIANLDQKLQAWRAQLPDYIDFEKPFDADRLPASLSSHHFFYLAFSYYGSLMAIHSIIVQPWNALAIQVCCNQRDQLRQQIQRSSDILLGSSRKIIQQLPHVKIEPSTHKWLTLTFPLNAVFNLFVQVLQNPTHATTDSDINLIYTAAGHYSYLEYLSPDQKFPFVGELANMARKAVFEAKASLKSKAKCRIESLIPSTISELQPGGEPFGTGPLLYDIFQLNGAGLSHFNNEDWGTLLVRDDWNYESPLSLAPPEDTPML